MTASFTEQMANSYPLLGIMSRGKFCLSPLFLVTLTKVRVQLSIARHSRA
jgi:hypothetical protein